MAVCPHLVLLINTFVMNYNLWHILLPKTCRSNQGYLLYKYQMFIIGELGGGGVLSWKTGNDFHQLMLQKIAKDDH